MATGWIKIILRLEGLALLLGAIAAYRWLDGSWVMFAILFFAPDLSFVGYTLGPRIGSFGYNVMHSTIGPFCLLGLGWLVDPNAGMHIMRDILTDLALIWFAHIGFDRVVGYGLKYASGFKDTHLGKIGRN